MWKKWLYKGNQSTFLIIVIIFAASLTCDTYLSTRLVLCPPLVISFILSNLITAWAIPKLKRLKLKQIIREEGPKAHYNKAGTPTMGGLIIVPVGLIIGNLLNIKDGINQQLLALSSIIFFYMLIGSLDDWKSLTKHTNAGLKAKTKIILQAFGALTFIGFANLQGWLYSSIALPQQMFIDLGAIIFPLGIFVFIAESNATNLTDGLDGLASGCGALIFTGLAIEIMLRGQDGELALAQFSMGMAGAWLGFLIHNQNPAKIFMGDTGSLAMGAAFSGLALITNNLWPLLIMGGVFLAESLSVIIQVLVFKMTKNITGYGQRIFLMTPLHHHFELAGKSEQKIVEGFWSITIILIIISLLLKTHY